MTHSNDVYAIDIADMEIVRLLLDAQYLVQKARDVVSEERVPAEEVDVAWVTATFKLCKALGILESLPHEVTEYDCRVGEDGELEAEPSEEGISLPCPFHNFIVTDPANGTTIDREDLLQLAREEGWSPPE